MKKISMVLVFLCICILCGCTKKKDQSDFYIYYLNMDVTGIVEEEYTPKNASGSSEALCEELLGRLQSEPDTATLRQTIPSDFKYSYSAAGYVVNVDLDSKYYDMPIVDQTLLRAAIVRTLVQIPAFSFVNFTVGSEPLLDSDDKVVGSMNDDSFVENPGAQINSKQTTDITLYFADANDPTKLRKKEETVTYTNKTLEKVVMEKLIEGPAEGDGMIATVPSGTKIITSSIYDGVCYINLTDAFINNQNNEITEQVVLYSIVDSLCSLEDVSKVQITVNGETTGMVRYNYKLAKLYKADDSIVIKDSSEEDSENINVTEEQ